MSARKHHRGTMPITDEMSMISDKWSRSIAINTPATSDPANFIGT
jgi:hypothetical protein